MPLKIVESVWYRTTLTGVPAYTALKTDEKADVAIIGAGYTGLSAARLLAKAGRKVIVCEKDRVGEGPSGCNGGQILTGLNYDIPDLATVFGKAEARAVWDLMEDTRQSVMQRAAAEPDTCDLRKGIIFAAMGPRHMRQAERNARVLARDFGYQNAILLSRAELEKYVRSPAYVGGTLYADTAHLNPYKYIHALAREVVQAGAQLCEQTPVLARNGKTLQTPQGTIKADVVISAAGADQTWPTRDFLRVNTCMVATAPLPESLLAEVLPGEACINDYRIFLNYMRRTPDNRLLFGGADTIFSTGLSSDNQRLLAELVRLYPPLKGVQIDDCWRGRLDVTRTQLPGVAEEEAGYYRAFGMSGHGFVLSHLAGEAMAEAVLGRKDKLGALGCLRPSPLSANRFLALAQIGLSLLPAYLKEKAGLF